MILVFVFLGIIIFISFISTILLASTIKINIQNLKLGDKNTKVLKKIDNNKYNVKILICFLGKIPIFWINLNNEKMEKIYSSEKLEKIDFKEIKDKVPINKNLFIILEKMNIKINKIKLKIELGTEDVILTSYLIAIISSFIGIILANLLECKNKEECKYFVKPLYNIKNEYYIELDSIIQIKIVHIINSMLIYKKKGSKKHERTSNRRSYAYRYE